MNTIKNSIVIAIKNKILILTIILFFIFFIISICIGQYKINIIEIIHLIFNYKNTDIIIKDVIINIRLPKVILASLCGGMLALSGICLQGVFKNPLAGPNIIGVSSGAAFGGVLAISFVSGTNIIFLSSFLFGLLALLIVLMISKYMKDFGNISLILSGIIVNGFFSALVGLIQYYTDEQEILPNIVFWLLGSFINANYEKIILILFIATPCIICLFLMRWRLNLFSLNNDDLMALDGNIKYIKLFILLLTTILIAAQVSVSGTIGWVGLVIPHITKSFGFNHLKSLPLCFILGAIFMLMVDFIATNLTSNIIPLGVLSALIGSPIFVFLIIKNKILRIN